ncbi:sensor histidine kinase [Flavobacterium sp. WG21]|uniref:sensor histidine kinase n=1 Tax=Flavobacterium sp. WG21 TaxID=1229487 RepID=UPI00034A2ED5|nr:histidine kinase [Flavobacterium sp. WG21]
MVLLTNIIILLVAFRLLFEQKIIGSLMKKQWTNLIRFQHILFFVIYTSFLVISTLYFTEMPFALYRILFIMAVNTVLYFVCYSYLVPAYYQTNKYPEYLLYALILFISTTLLRLLVEPEFSQESDAVQDQTLFLISVYSSQSIVILVASFLGISRHKFLIEYDYLDLEVKKNETDLNLMKSKINPHFLLNTLNNIYAGSYNQHGNTTEAILQLSQLLQYVIYETDKKTIAIHKEFEMMKALAGLYQLKYNNTLNIVFELNDSEVQEQVEVPPSIYFTLFENALKHSGIGADREAYIKVNFDKVDDTFVFRIENSVPEKIHFNNHNGYNGMGLVALKKILTMKYAENYQLFDELLNKTYFSTLKIKL